MLNKCIVDDYPIRIVLSGTTFWKTSDDLRITAIRRIWNRNIPGTRNIINSSMERMTNAQEN